MRARTVYKRLDPKSPSVKKKWKPKLIDCFIDKRTSEERNLFSAECLVNI
jgi:hypothetical protein